MSFSHSNRKNRGSAIVGVLITLIVLLLVADTAVIALCFCLLYTSDAADE